MFTDTKKLSEDGAWVHVKDMGKPAYLDGDKKKPIRIKVLGPDSPTLQEKARKRVAKRLKANGGSVDMSKMSQVEIEAFLENSQGAECENWADATIAWENMPAPEGGAQDFTASAAETLYAAYPAITRQLAEEAGGIDDFLALAAEN